MFTKVPLPVPASYLNVHVLPLAIVLLHTLFIYKDDATEYTEPLFVVVIQPAEVENLGTELF